MSATTYVIPFEKLGIGDIAQVGGKNASLGEMIANLSGVGVKVPGGFATTAEAFAEFMEKNKLNNSIHSKLEQLDIEDVAELAKVGAQIRQDIEAAPFVPEFEQAVRESYEAFVSKGGSVAVRSSATAEDLPDASFAGQQETYLNVTGIESVLSCIKKVFASLFNDRAIAYRVHHGFDHKDVLISAGIQQMVRSDLASSGVMFSLDTESGFDDVVFITSAYGLGELVVQGVVNPDEFYVHKPSLNAGKKAIVRRNVGHKQQRMVYVDKGDALVKTEDVPPSERMLFSLTDSEVEALAKQVILIEKHYKRPMDVEWAKDGLTGELFIVQARPETVKSRDQKSVLETYQLADHDASILVEGRSIGQRIGAGEAVVISSLDDMDKVVPGTVLVTDMTDPDWEPVMKRAAAIVTNRGGRTCHAAIIARELGIPAVVGCGSATKDIKSGQPITVSCAEGDVGRVYNQKIKFDIKKVELNKMPAIPFKVMMNVGNPDRAFAFQSLPNEGVGLARLEFIISQMIGIHPKACLEAEMLSDELKAEIYERTAAYDSPRKYYVKKLAEGISTIAAAFSPKRVIIRLSDFKSNEYANLLGGDIYEPEEENPMIGFRGASRYVSPSFMDAFALECEAVRWVREEMGLTNVEIMIPFVRTLEEAKKVHEVLQKHGLERGKDGLKVIMMCELPTNAVLAERFLEYFDGFSIGSNDMTQLTLGLDRDSGIVAQAFDERDPAVKEMLKMAITACKKQGKYVGICGQGPSDHPDLAQWLVEQGIDSVSLNPDTVLETWLYVAEHLSS
ncbi:MAG: phosphoenolpyruvate synthase [Legionellales bacterium]|nr:phosphoenolpyruvate synthase [Legionellales bacterium]